MHSARPSRSAREVSARSTRNRLRISQGARHVLEEIDPSATPGVRGKKEALRRAAKLQLELAELQERLFAEGTRSLLIVLQGMDTSGKDGTIKHALSSLNPSGVTVTSFKQPSEEELAHDFLWRIRRALPRAGEIAIFNRSHYEDVGIVRVHSLVPEAVWASRYDVINRFEKELVSAGTQLVKVFLHISSEEQRKRLVNRLENPKKRWKFKEADIDERARWDDYRAAYDDAIGRCSTEHAPWFVIPANRKWYRNWAVSRLLVETLREMDPRYPEPELDIPALRARLSEPITRSRTAS
jgi:PPK2 family polyphosphate:nucleotide phosphotransferase